MNQSIPPGGALSLSLQRFALVSKVEDLLPHRIPLRTALETVARVAVQGPDGLELVVAVRTLEDCWYAFRHGGFQALHPKSCSDRSLPWTLTAEQQQRILAAVRSQPTIHIKVLYRWRFEDPTLPAISSIYRCLRSHDLDQRSRRFQLRQTLSGPTKAFESPAVNELWMADFSPGPICRFPARPPDRQPSCAPSSTITPDSSSPLPTTPTPPPAASTPHSRKPSDAAACLASSTPIRTDPSSTITPAWSLPTSTSASSTPGHTIRGARARSNASSVPCSRISRPSSDDPAMAQPPSMPSTADWLRSVSRVLVHDGTEQLPQTHFQNTAHQIRSVNPSLDLDRLFQTRLEHTVRLDSQLYEVDPALRGLEIQIHFDHWTKARIEVSYKGQAFDLARPVNLHLNR